MEICNTGGSLWYQHNQYYQNILSKWPLLEIFPRQEFARAAK